ncbi:MAG: hypothetical protein FJ184_13810 [Gammaproteobacteria bacterium]|nr:hypothetical protein [Gammaproteobacteria bacterium]
MTDAQWEEVCLIYPDHGFYPEKFITDVSEVLEEFRAQSRSEVALVLGSQRPLFARGRRRLLDAVCSCCEAMLLAAIHRYSFRLDQMPVEKFELLVVDTFIEQTERFCRLEYSRLASQIPGMSVSPIDSHLAHRKAEWIRSARSATESALRISACIDGSIHNSEDMLLREEIRHQIAMKDFGVPPERELRSESWRTQTSGNCVSEPGEPSNVGASAVAGDSQVNQNIAYERKERIAAYKREVRVTTGEKLTDKLLAQKACDQWNDRTNISRYKSASPKLTAGDEHKIEKMLQAKPHLKR